MYLFYPNSAICNRPDFGAPKRPAVFVNLKHSRFRHIWLCGGRQQVSLLLHSADLYQFISCRF
ncbi:hypothetical protein BVG80_15520 [Sphingobacteriales bacterium TSM_CSM]|nr:hypothetical protein BVG80_15520 [Sphingobacteriales bacterium TSM_CSM]